MDDIKEIVHRVIGQMAPAQSASSQQLHALWGKALETKELKHTRLSGFKRGSLFVDVDSPAWLYQMNMRQAKILGKLKEDNAEIKNINFRVGRVK